MARSFQNTGRAWGRVSFVACAALLALAPAAVQGQTVEAFDTAFKDWMKRHRVARGVLAVSHDNYLALVKGYGGLDPGKPVPLASLAKAITGACVATLVRDK